MTISTTTNKILFHVEYLYRKLILEMAKDELAKVKTQRVVVKGFCR